MTTPNKKLKVFVMTPKEHIKQIEDYLVHYRKNSFELSETKWLIARVKHLEKTLEFLDRCKIKTMCEECRESINEALTTHPTETE